MIFHNMQIGSSVVPKQDEFKQLDEILPRAKGSSDQ